LITVTSIEFAINADAARRDDNIISGDFDQVAGKRRGNA
jgi:hypothetical protein